MSRIKIGAVSPKEFYTPSISKLVRALGNETLFVFGNPVKFSDTRFCLGVGKVRSVEKGKEFDVVKINFGYLPKTILVFDKNARKQIYTLKKDELAWFVGFYKLYRNVEGEVMKQTFFATGFQGWYVPKAYDIKNYDLDTVEEMTKEHENDLANYLDDIIKNGEVL